MQRKTLEIIASDFAYDCHLGHLTFSGVLKQNGQIIESSIDLPLIETCNNLLAIALELTEKGTRNRAVNLSKQNNSKSIILGYPFCRCGEFGANVKLAGKELYFEEPYVYAHSEPKRLADFKVSEEDFLDEVVNLCLECIKFKLSTSVLPKVTSALKNYKANGYEIVNSTATTTHPFEMLISNLRKLLKKMKRREPPQLRQVELIISQEKELLETIGNPYLEDDVFYAKRALKNTGH